MNRCYLVIALVLAATPVAAHPLDIGYLRIEATDSAVAITLDLESTVAAQLVGVRTLDQMTVRTGTRLAEATYLRAPITSDRGPCRWDGPTARLVGRTASQHGRAMCPPGATTLRWELPVISTLPSTFRMLVKVRGFGGELVTILDRANPVLDLARDAHAVSFGGFVWSGVEHIGAAPSEWRDAGGWKLPDGIDHILFLFALLLGGGTLIRLLGIATGFTLGHSITLALAAFDVVRVPGWIVEPLIALTIAFAALEAISGRYERHRAKIATAFGLVHGFGFASALTELGLSTGNTVKALFGYNLGVELGQVAIVLVTTPVVMLLYRKPRTRRLIVPGLGIAIFAAGMYWFVERAFG
ncbi:MAG: HupE/UreJ family protein [Kofleriaceae bacterium]